jgi:uncharacterized protein YjbI with pentapeptide repeats/endonuclease YncB( thermonuclease family)
LILWLIVAAAVLALLGALLLIPQLDEPSARGSLGQALITGAALSLALIVVQEYNDQNRKKATSAQERIAKDQALEITVGLQHDLAGVDLQGQNLAGVDLGTKDLIRADLRRAQLKQAQLVGARLMWAHLDGANLIGANLTEARLQNATLGGAHLEGAYFNLAQLGGATVGRGPHGKAAYLARANFTDADLRGACLAGADLHGANVHGADFSGAVLTDVDLRGAQLEEDGVPVNLKATWAARVLIDGKDKHYLPTASAMRRRLGRPRIASPPSATITDRVVTTFDGDTIKLQHRGWVSLIGLNAPGRNDEIGRQAKNFVEHALPTNAPVRYQLGPQPREPFPREVGRWRAYVWLRDGRFLNASLLEAGYAQREVKPPEANRYRPVLEQAEQRAKAGGLGVWKTCRGR